jgi:hypothetical protein
MNDRQLFRKLLLHFAIGATLGGIFSGVLLILNIQHVLDVVQSSVAPKTNHDYSDRRLLHLFCLRRHDHRFSFHLDG